MMQHMVGKLGSKLAVGLFIIGGIQLNEIRQAPDSGLRLKIDQSLQSLQHRDLSINPGPYTLDILSLSMTRTATEIEPMLREADATPLSAIYSFRQKNQWVAYTMSAPGIDKSHHLVNSYLEGYQPFTVTNVALPLYVLAQRKSYMLDEDQYYGLQEIWQTSRQAFYYPRGDCEDHALLLADWLIAMGEDARVVLGDMKGGGHAWVILFRDGEEYLLESTRKRGVGRNRPYPLAKLHPDYHPEYMFNRDYFWVNSGTKFTTRYHGPHWEKRSRYNKHTGSGDSGADFSGRKEV